MTTTLKLNSVAFAYGQQPVLKNISLAVKTGQIGCLLGPSGCGKSTLLRLIAGFEQPHSGEIHIVDKKVAGPNESTSPQNREVGMLFQDLALFPHLSVYQNIAFGLHQLNKSSQQQRIDDLLSLCRLDGFESRYPHQLSGGQSQRAALARAMAPKPKLILLDEPFSSVETGLQSDLVHEVKSMLQADNSTALWVTHSLDEAYAVADQMGVMLDGKLLQWANPTELYENPEHADVVSFLNHANLVIGKVTADNLLQTPIGAFKLSNIDEFELGESVQISIDKEQLSIETAEQNNAVVTACVYQGSHYVITARLNDDNIIKHHSRTPLTSGISVNIQCSLSQSSTGFPTKKQQPLA